MKRALLFAAGAAVGAAVVLPLTASASSAPPPPHAHRTYTVGESNTRTKTTWITHCGHVIQADNTYIFEHCSVPKKSPTP